MSIFPVWRPRWCWDSYDDLAMSPVRLIHESQRQSSMGSRKGTRRRGSKKTLEKLTEGPVNSGWYQLKKLGTACREPCSKAISNKKSSARFWDLDTRRSRGSRREEETTKGSTRARIQQDLPSWAPRCPRIWLSRMGLISHLRACPPPLAGPLHNWSSETKKCHHHHYRV